MGYLIGAGPLDPAVKRYNGGTSSFTMDNSGTTNGKLLWVDGVAQVPGTDYNVSGTTITTTTAAAAGTNTVVSLQLFNTGLITTPADNTVTSAKIVDGTIVTADLSDDAVTVAKLVGGVLADGYAGTDFDLGTNTTGTETLDYTNGNFQKGVNGGAHTLAPQATTSTIIVQYTNDGSAGSLTTSGYTIVTGDTVTTTSGHDFMMYSTRVNGFKHLHVVALQ
jgi:hypothetical protein